MVNSLKALLSVTKQMVYNESMNDSFELQSMPRHSGMFQPGQSGNPSGRPKMDITIRDLARGYTEEAIETLAEIMKNPKSPPSCRTQAACALLDRGWGKPAQFIEAHHTGGGSYMDFLDMLADQDEKDPWVKSHLEKLDTPQVNVQALIVGL